MSEDTGTREPPPPRLTKERLLAIRVPAALLARIDAYGEQLRARTPWIQMTRSDVVRWLLAEGLADVRKEGPEAR